MARPIETAFGKTLALGMIDATPALPVYRRKIWWSGFAAGFSLGSAIVAAFNLVLR